MTWVKLDDAFFTHPKVVDLSNEAKLLYIAGLAYCSANLTDGAIPRGAVRIVGAMANVDTAGPSDELASVGLWERGEAGFMVHDYLEYNPTAETVKQTRAATAKRQAEWRERQTQARNGVTNAVTNAPNNGPVTPTRIDPLPENSRVLPGTTNGVENPHSEAVVVVAPHGATTTTNRVPLVQCSKNARAVLEAWRLAHGKRSPPKLNPTQAAKLEEAIADLGLERLLDAVQWSAARGLTEFHKCLSAARTKRQQDEAPPARASPERNGHARTGLRFRQDYTADDLRDTSVLKHLQVDPIRKGS